MKYGLFCAGAAAALVLAATVARAGPPYETDDPDPVDCHHVEIDAAYARQGSAPETLPTIEIDYGPTRNVELSYNGQRGENDISAAFRFIQETKTTPRVGFLPSVNFLSDGRTETFLPLWLQKSEGSWTAFGGFGESQSSAVRGLALQHDVASDSSVGIEYYGETARTAEGTSRSRLNIGYIAQHGTDRALMLSAGRSFGPFPVYSFYVGYQFILAPRRHAANCP